MEHKKKNPNKQTRKFKLESCICNAFNFTLDITKIK